MIQALKQMHSHLNLVLTDSTGATGMAMLRAIVAGERDPDRLAQFRHAGCTHAEAEIATALTGTWDATQLCILQQSLDRFDSSTSKLADCATNLEHSSQGMAARGEPEAPVPDLPHTKPQSTSKNDLRFNARAQMARVIGVDLVAVMGLSAVTVQTMISEIGTDMRRFPSVKQFCSWVGLAPHNDSSGGKVVRSRTMKVRNRAKGAFRQAAQSVAQSTSSCGAYDRAMRARLGPRQAIVATAHTSARVGYHMLKTGEPYREASAAEDEQQRQERELKHRARRAKKGGYILAARPPSTPEGAPEPAHDGSS